MTESSSEEIHEPSLVKGLIAGVIGGLAGTVAMTFAERIFPPHSAAEEEPSPTFTEQVAGHPLSGTEREAATEGIHWALGVTAGAVYGALAEYYPAAASKGGVSFGMALEALTQEKALPAMGMPAPPEDQTTRERASEMTSYVVFGIATEMVRSFVRGML